MRLSFADGLFWASVACCAVAQFFILRSVSGRRRRALPELAAAPTAAALPRQRGAVEIVWAVVPAVALAVLLLFTWRAMRAVPASVPDAPASVGMAR